jgi:hypothetical protein
MAEGDEDNESIDSWLSQFPKMRGEAEEDEPTVVDPGSVEPAPAEPSEAPPANTWAALLDEEAPVGAEANAGTDPLADQPATSTGTPEVPPVMADPDEDDAPTTMEHLPPSLLAEPPSAEPSSEPRQNDEVSAPAPSAAPEDEPLLALEDPPLSPPAAPQRRGLSKSRKLVIAVYALVAALAAILITLVITGEREDEASTLATTGPTSATSTSGATEEPDVAGTDTTVADAREDAADAAAANTSDDNRAPAHSGFEIEPPDVPLRIRRLSWRTRRRRARNHRIVALRLFGRMRYERAETSWREALVYDPNNRYTAQGLARTLRALGREEEADAWQARADGARARMRRR